MKIGKDNR